MTVVVKNTPETTTSSLLRTDPLPVASLLGCGYVLAGLVGIFYVLPAMWWDWLSLPRTPVVGALLILAMVVAAGAWVFGAVRLTAAGSPAGTRAGVFCGLLELLIIVWPTRWVLCCPLSAWRYWELPPIIFFTWPSSAR